MKRWLRGASLFLVVAAATLGMATAVAQDAADDGPLPPPPPEVQRLLELVKDPDRLREATSDPEKIQQLMASMETDAVREFMSDPRRVQQLMREVNPLQIAEAMRAVDFAKVRVAALMRWKSRLKQQLGVSDEEWKALEPRIDGLVRAQQEARPTTGGGRGGMGLGFGFGGGGGGIGLPAPVAPGADPSPVQEAAAELRAAMEDPDGSAAEVRRCITAYRKAREQARQKVEKAEQELRELLTLRQEAILVIAGLLN